VPWPARSSSRRCSPDFHLWLGCPSLARQNLTCSGQPSAACRLVQHNTTRGHTRELWSPTPASVE
jgi:hypothetical protein